MTSSVATASPAIKYAEQLVREPQNAKRIEQQFKFDLWARYLQIVPLHTANQVYQEARFRSFLCGPETLERRYATIARRMYG